ncbi:MAG: Ser-Thr-rich GPI-anchored membrane family protein [bacterium]
MPPMLKRLVAGLAPFAIVLFLSTPTFAQTGCPTSSDGYWADGYNAQNLGYFIYSTPMSNEVYTNKGSGFIRTLKMKNVGTTTWYNSGCNALQVVVKKEATSNSAPDATGFEDPTSPNYGKSWFFYPTDMYNRGWVNQYVVANMVEASVPPGGTGSFDLYISYPGNTPDEAFTEDFRLHLGPWNPTIATEPGSLWVKDTVTGEAKYQNSAHVLMNFHVILKIFSPTNGEVITPGTQYTIKWHVDMDTPSSLVPTSLVLQQYLNGTFVNTVLSNAPSTNKADNSFVWTVPTDVLPSVSYIIVNLKDSAGNLVDNINSGYFYCLYPTATPTPTFTSSPTKTYTPTGTATLTPTKTLTNTVTNTFTSTATITNTSTSTFTPTDTATDTPTNTFTVTATATDTSTSTFTSTDTATDTPTDTATNTPTNTFTFTPTDTTTDTPTNTFTPTDTATDTPTNTFTLTATATDTSTNTFTPTDTATDTPTDTFTPTDTTTNTFTVTATVTDTSTNTFSPTDTATDTPTATFTITVTATETSTSTLTPTETATNTVIPTDTFTETPTETSTSTVVTPTTPTDGVTVCLVIVNKDGSLAYDDNLADTSFSIPLYDQPQPGYPKDPSSYGTSSVTAKFQAPFIPNTNILDTETRRRNSIGEDKEERNDKEKNSKKPTSKNDAICQKVSFSTALKIPQSIAYGQLSTTSNLNWEKPKYNDQYTKLVDELRDFFFYDNSLFDGKKNNEKHRNQNADGHISVTTKARLSRPLVILARQSTTKKNNDDKNHHNEND